MKELRKQVKGWFNYEDLYKDMVAKAKDGDTIVEVGVYQGLSIIALAKYIEQSKKDIKIFGVDNFSGIKSEFEIDSLDSLKAKNIYEENLKKFNVYDKITTIYDNSVKSADLFENGSIQFVFIDANHSYLNCKNDIIAWLPKVKYNGYIGGHDWKFIGVKEAVSEVLQKSKKVSKNCWLYHNIYQKMNP